MRNKKFFKFKIAFKKGFAVYMALTLFFEVAFPSASMALTGGPSQPEVQSFEPVGTSEIVDPFSGDFTYNVPLLDVDGYPVNISYHSNITMDQEASWTGLGWNINPGVINRGMRGIPDDFNGENITKEINMKNNTTFGLTLGIGVEFLGKDKPKVPGGASGLHSSGGIEYGLSVRFNNYTGVGVDQSITGHIPLGEAGKTPFTGSLGLTSSSDNGLTLQPNVGYSAKLQKNGSTKLGASIGTSFNSRGGLSQLTIGVNVQKSFRLTNKNDAKKTVRGGIGVGGSSSFNFGMPTYTPQLTLPFQSFALSASFKIGPEAEGANVYGRIAGFYSTQKLIQKTLSQPAFGYLNADEGVKYNNAVMDFNREKDIPFHANSTPDLPVTNFTYDLLSVSGQGISGSYRPFRSDFGHVFDPHVSNTSTSASIGAEVGLGELWKLGVDVTVSHVTSQSGEWNNSDGSNPSYNDLYFTQNSADPTYERYYYKEANEKSVDSDPSFLQRAGGLGADSYGLDELSKFHTVNTGYFTAGGHASGTRNARAKRSQNISTLSRAEMSTYGLLLDPQLSTEAQPYHTGEITSITPDGKRYVYGIAAYNNRQEETTFSIGQDEFFNGGWGTTPANLNSYTDMVNYPSGSNSLSNANGIDNYFGNTIMPPYAHSYFLTAVLSSDYVDVDAVRGPSVNDLGSYTLFNYTKVNPAYKWRIPYGQDSATFNEGLKWTQQDDKANYVYGEKELWYLSSIVTKNYIAVFDITTRNDGYGVIDKDGGLNSACPMYKLDQISLYTLKNYDAHQANSAIALIPIKQVHFAYDYSLCPGVPNSNSSAGGGGKLTLKEISFSYQSSQKGRLSPYKFTYSTSNPGYNIKAYDRWGNYKAPDPNLVSGDPTNEMPWHQGLSNAEFPYVIQDTTIQNPNVRAWALTQIGLPSGGTINVDYESDDYAYVQNKQAAQMFKIVGLSGSTTSLSSGDTATSTGHVEPRTMLDNSQYFVIKLSNPVSSNAEFQSQYLSGLNYIYFRFLYNMSNTTAPSGDSASYEYVPGYVPSSMISASGIYPGGKYAYIKFSDVTTNDHGGSTVSPVTKAAIQYGRLNEPKNVWSQPTGVSSQSNFGLQLLKALGSSSFVNNISDAISGPNQALFVNHNCNQNFYLNKSWIRLNCPTMHKLGGGSRVSKISISDQWHTMTSSAMPSFSYGQQYFYNNEDGTSSGVATYEPQLGGDENPWRTPVFFDITHVLAPNDEQYLEEPFGESFFPSPSVGYGRVTVQNLQYSGVSKHATGQVVHTFWTAKDFPVITSRTGLQAIREKTDPLSLSSFLHIDSKDYMTAAQGYYVELNDMHGKPKGQFVYQQGVSIPISSIEYDYQKTPYGVGSYRLNNTAQVVDPTGNISSQNLGVFYDFVGDFREEKASTISGSVNFNLDVSEDVIPVFVFTVWPGFSSDKTRFRSNVVTKVSNRFGLQQRTIAKDLGSTVETDNLAYDSETGGVILTKTITDYNDPIYTLNYPAYWYYTGMGPAYKNIDISMSGVNFISGVGSIGNASSYFVPGDEIEMNSSSGNVKAWLLSVSNSSITVEQKDGTIPPPGIYNIKIIRSGNRNQQSVNMASITSLSNPLNGLNNNVYTNVVQASGVEFNEQWNIFCDCISTYHGANPAVSYVTGGKGNWRPRRSFSYLTGRTQSSTENNTNTRKDGVFTSYNPLYRKSGSAWQLDTTNWTFTSMVTIISHNGLELENRDALGRYSAATYNYNQTLATAVSANARFREIGFDNVEAYSSNCADGHFTFANPVIDSLQAHTGRKSLRVSSTNPLTMLKVLKVDECPATPYCDIMMTNTGTTNYAFSGTGAISPLTISWQISNGNPSISIASGNQLNVVSTGNWSAMVTVIGATGCTQRFTIGNQVMVNSNLIGVPGDSVISAPPVLPH